MEFFAYGALVGAGISFMFLYHNPLAGAFFITIGTLAAYQGFPV